MADTNDENTIDSPTVDKSLDSSKKALSALKEWSNMAIFAALWMFIGFVVWIVTIIRTNHIIYGWGQFSSSAAYTSPDVGNSGGGSEAIRTCMILNLLFPFILWPVQLWININPSYFGNPGK